MSRLLRATAKHPGKASSPTGTLPFRYLRFYDAPPGSGGRLLADIDFAGASSSLVGSSTVLNSTVNGTVTDNGVPTDAVFYAADGTTVVGDQVVKQPIAVTDANHQVVNDSVPDTTAVNPGNWIKGSIVTFDPGDITYQA